MSIEENEDIAVRGLLGTVFAGAEPPLRDLASGSIARGDAARSRNRKLLATGGAMLSVAAVIGTFAVVTGATPGKHGNPNPVNQQTSEPPPVKPTGYLGFGPRTVGIDKIQDLQNRLSAALQPLLPAGITFGQVRYRSDLMSQDQVGGILSGPTGANVATMWVGLVPPTETDSIVRQVACRPGGTCRTRTVDGGTVYLDEHINTEADQVLTGSGFPPDVLKPGTEKNIVSRTLSMTFVPADRAKYAFNIKLAAATAKVQYADHEPGDAEPGIPWPPTWNTPAAYDPSGLLLSADDFTAMLAKPGLDKVEYMLDPRTAVSREAAAEIAAAEGRAVSAAEAALPPGMKVSLDISKPEPESTLAGPTGGNQFFWQSMVLAAKDRQQQFTCSPSDACSKRTVPGGTLEVMINNPPDSNHPASQIWSVYHYWFLPDDLSKPVLSMTLGTEPLAAQSSSSDPAATGPAKTSPAQHGPYAPVQVSADQFLAAAEDGRLATAITATQALTAAFR